MRIAVASGKGGTGKTTVALALAETLGPRGVLVDCDVEEPNCHLFVDAPVVADIPVCVQVPRAPTVGCSGCGRCVKACRFNALALLGRRVLVFKELCHSCGGCVLSCPEHALEEEDNRIGSVVLRRGGGFTVVSGVLDVGHPMAVPLIRRVKEEASPAGISIVDCPPGTSCPMVASVRGCNYVILVTEPSPFGLHDLRLAVETLRGMGMSCGVVVNRDVADSDPVGAYCAREHLDVLMRIPLSREIAEGGARGERLLTSVPGLRPAFAGLLREICVS